MLSKTPTHFKLSYDVMPFATKFHAFYFFRSFVENHHFFPNGAQLLARIQSQLIITFESLFSSVTQQMIHPQFRLKIKRERKSLKQYEMPRATERRTLTKTRFLQLNQPSRKIITDNILGINFVSSPLKKKHEKQEGRNNIITAHKRRLG